LRSRPTRMAAKPRATRPRRFQVRPHGSRSLGLIPRGPTTEALAPLSTCRPIPGSKKTRNISLVGGDEPPRLAW
jgi:hypothetical protein